MSQPLLPLIVEPAELEKHLSDERLLIVDLGRPETHAQAHVPGAVPLDYARIVRAAPPALGLLPDEAQLSEALSELGLASGRHVVAYDDEGNGRAARLLWTLDAIGHAGASLLNGGILAWHHERHPLSNEAARRTRSRCAARYADRAVADKRYILDRLGDPGVKLVDARSPGEYRGETVRAARGGHIPGAVNFDWVEAMDRERNLRLRPAEELRARLGGLGVTPDKEVIVYCHTHHRSAHTYIVLKSLGYPRVKGYPGSWSEWGNSPDVPVE